ncbi:bifunctional protein-serine/threonine kinase/phosphatase [Catenovulum sediminis]|uniref:Bifunctional protein-serine/threonine kinase/phosphatase n=1 Tax=Catenovulum sediminis TaxID=1740262 RepID=A0ABV1RDU5_9ALTE
MKKPLRVSVGQASQAGVKRINQDFIGRNLPQEPLLSSKGIVLAMADGISSSKVSQIASQAAVAGFIEDYYCTSDSWSVKTSAQKVLSAINAWLYAQSQNSPNRYDKDKGYICTFSALILKSNTAHLFHSGDTRIFRLVDDNLEVLTRDHRRVVSADVSYLTRALGVEPILELDYQKQILETGDTYVLATDGIYEFLTDRQIVKIIQTAGSQQEAADTLITEALKAGSDDNLSIQIVRIEHVPDYQLDEVQQFTSLPLPPTLAARKEFDGFQIIRELYISSRSHVFLAKDSATEQTLVIKTPSTELASDSKYLERFMLEEWIAKRVDHVNVAKAIDTGRKRNYLYLATEYIEGQSLAQWMLDNPKPSLNEVRSIVEQIAKGLQAFHRQEMIHQDIRPQNILIDADNTVKIIDFGSIFIAGVTDSQNEEAVRGTMRYSAPEYFLGQQGSPRSDIFALAVITYQMLSGRFPYSIEIAQAKSTAAQRRLNYRSVIDETSELPAWIDDALQKALQIDPLKRYAELSEFVYDLHHPNKSFLQRTKPPLIQRSPVMFWQGISFILLLLLLWQQTS